MTEILSVQAKLISSMIMFAASFLVAQMSKFDPIISQGFDQLLSLGFFIVATVVLWRALQMKEKEITKKEDEHRKFKQETIDKLIEMVERNEKKGS